MLEKANSVFPPETGKYNVLIGIIKPKFLDWFASVARYSEHWVDTSKLFPITVQISLKIKVSLLKKIKVGNWFKINEITILIVAAQISGYWEHK